MLYGWICEHDSVLSTAQKVKNWDDWDAYPLSWPCIVQLNRPLETLPFSGDVLVSADNRIKSIRRDLENAGEFYPREEVLAALEYWKVKI